MTTNVQTTSQGGFDMSRSAFNAVLNRVREKVPLTPYQRAELWYALNGIDPPDVMPPPTPRYKHWTYTAMELLQPLHREIATCEQGVRSGHIERRYRGVTATLPGRHGKVAAGATRPPLVVDVLEAFDTYRAELTRIRREMEEAFRENGHWLYRGSPPAERIGIIVENERAAGHPAGTEHWTQWALPGLKKQITTIFEQAREKTSTRGRVWTPYPSPTTAKKGTT